MKPTTELEKKLHSRKLIGVYFKIMMGFLVMNMIFSIFDIGDTQFKSVIIGVLYLTLVLIIYNFIRRT